MNLALIDPFVLAQDYPESTTATLRSGFSTCIRFNRGGDLLASGRVDGLIVIFDTETNGVARKFSGHKRQVQSLSWSKDSRYLLSASQDCECFLWDVERGSVVRTVEFAVPVYFAELHPMNPFMFVCSLFEHQPYLVDMRDTETKKSPLISAPKRIEEDVVNTKQAAQDAKMTTTITIFTASGNHILAGTNKGWLNIIEVATQKTIYSTKICVGVVIFLRLTASGRDVVVNAQDRIIRTIQLPNLNAKDLDPDEIHIDVEHKFQDVVNRLSWNHVAFSSTGEYVTASTYNNHDIYIWERNHGSLVKILEGPKEEHGVVEWHPNKPLIAACGLESGRIHIWSIISPQRWSALAPDFIEVEENVDYIEHEDEFDIHPQEELHKRQLNLENEDVDVLGIEPLKGEIMDQENDFKMPVILDLDDAESEEELVLVATGVLRRKSPGDGRIIVEDEGFLGSADEKPAPKRAVKKGQTKKKR